MAEAACPVCQNWFVPASARHRYCSPACRKTAWERSHTQAPSGATHAAPLPGEPGDVYACARCHRRRLGPGRCTDCDTWLTRVGLGGACPYCSRPVAVRDLIEEVMSPEA